MSIQLDPKRDKALIERAEGVQEPRNATKRRSTGRGAAPAQQPAPRGSGLEAAFLTHLRRHAPDVRLPVREFRFAPPRRWAFDFCWPDCRVAVETEGGVWVQGRHNRPAGYEGDCYKYNCATVEGWRVLRFTSSMLTTDPAACIALVVEALEMSALAACNRAKELER
jgi:very-short-patch-repair endonuclease